MLKDSENKNPDIIIISTGSEIELSIEIYNELINNYKIRVVSIPSTNIFEKQDKNYINNVITKNSIKIIIELSTTNFWNKYINNDKSFIIGIDDFGKSGSYKDIKKHFNLNKENIIKKIKNVL
ncbi:transketolase-like TK C-terminal-containing protein [Candidatus Nardonella dryophthoridicola]|uniref:transketolase-like TK C-terminal-containing protein n=1 Tax=Candidatus Nardonella dryophthoridicola TaxID=1971485 RepID=UPI003B96C9A0